MRYMSTSFLINTYIRVNASSDKLFYSNQSIYTIFSRFIVKTKLRQIYSSKYKNKFTFLNKTYLRVNFKTDFRVLKFLS